MFFPKEEKQAPLHRSDFRSPNPNKRKAESNRVNINQQDVGVLKEGDHRNMARFANVPPSSPWEDRLGENEQHVADRQDLFRGSWRKPNIVSQQPDILAVWWPSHPASLAAGVAWAMLQNVLSQRGSQRGKQGQYCLTCASETDQARQGNPNVPCTGLIQPLGLKVHSYCFYFTTIALLS